MTVAWLKTPAVKLYSFPAACGAASLYEQTLTGGTTLTLHKPAASLGTAHAPSVLLSHQAAPFFVMAHHRSGSNFLNDLLQSHPQVECINEPLSMHTHFFREHDLNFWSAGDFDDDTLHPSLAAQEPLRAFLHDFRHYLGRSDPSRVIGFKDTVLFGKLE